MSRPTPGDAKHSLRRRAFLRCGAAAAGGLWSHLAAGRPPLAHAAPAERSDVSVILVWMDGGPSQLETFDPKPAAPAEIRGEFGSIPTALPDVRFCEHLPLIARVADRLAIVRSLHHEDNLHEGAIHWAQTGFGYPRQFDPVNARMPRNPAAGAVVANRCGAARAGLPPYVKLFKDGGYEHSYQGALHLGRQYDPLAVGGDIRQRAFTEPNPFDAAHLEAPALALPGDVSLSRLQNRRELADRFDALRARVERDASRTGVEHHPRIGRMDAYRQQAYDLLLADRVRDAFDLSREAPRLRERYGRHLWGQGALLARRLVEAGVRFVTLNLHGDPPPPLQLQFSWDTHGDHFSAMRQHLLPVFDRLFSALVEDLAERGLTERVLVVAMGEFGRTPRIFSDGRMGAPGRGHWAQAYSAAVFGGGLRAGQVVGSTDATAAEPRDRPLAPQDLLATLYARLGIEADAVITDNQGRPSPLLPDARPIDELLG